MVLLGWAQFLSELHKAFTKSKAEKKGSVQLSMTRYQPRIYEPQEKQPKQSKKKKSSKAGAEKPDAAAAAAAAAAYPKPPPRKFTLGEPVCLVRARLDDHKFSTHIALKDVPRFHAQYNLMIKGSADNLLSNREAKKRRAAVADSSADGAASAAAGGKASTKKEAKKVKPAAAAAATGGAGAAKP